MDVVNVGDLVEDSSDSCCWRLSVARAMKEKRKRE